MKEKNKYGQYMTPDIMADFMISLIQHDENSKCLEPSCGDGVFLENLNKHQFHDLVGIEIDKNLINEKFNVLNTSFLKCDFKKQFDVVIGNPPYIRWKNLEPELKKELESDGLWNLFCNTLCDYSAIFILKSIEALRDNGELIFITSDYWFSTTHAQKIRNFILEKGYIDSIFHFDETPIFDGVNASFVIFRFVKDVTKSPNITVTQYYSRKKINQEIILSIKNNSCENMKKFKIPQFKKDEKWILAPASSLSEINKFEKACNNHTIGEFCDIGNGMVSGLDKAFQIPSEISLNQDENDNVLEVIKAKHLEAFYHSSSVKYIFLDKISDELVLKNKFQNFYNQLRNYKNLLWQGPW